MREERYIEKVRVGEFLSHRDDFNQQVLKVYMSKLDFKMMHVEEAIRVYLQGFGLPTEAQARVVTNTPI